METPDATQNAGKETPQQGVLNVGMTLREAREHMGMSVGDIAERIKFAPRQVEALEANDFAHLPESAFLRGFVRSYARVLQLDEVALVAALPVEPSKQVVAKIPTIDVPFPTLQSLRRANVLWLAGALGVALVLALFVLLNDGEPAKDQTELVVEPVILPASDVVAASAVVAEIQPAKSPVPSKIVEEKKSGEPGKPVEVSKAAEPKKTVAKVEQPVVKAEPQAISSTPVPAVEDAAKPVATSLEMLKRRPMHFVFSKDTWAEVVDVNGAVLLSKTNKAGSEQWIGGPRRAPYDVKIAHPANVRLYYKGREIDLSAYAAMDIAHLKVE